MDERLSRDDLSEEDARFKHLLAPNQESDNEDEDDWECHISFDSILDSANVEVSKHFITYYS